MGVGVGVGVGGGGGNVMKQTADKVVSPPIPPIPRFSCFPTPQPQLHHLSSKEN